MLLTILAASGVIFALFLLLRFRIQMAALVAWIVGTLTASTNKEVKPTVQEKSTTPKSPTSRKNKKTNSKKSSSKNKKSKTAEELQVETSDREASVTTKYQTVSAQDPRRRSLDFGILLNKLEKIQEKTEANEEFVVENKLVVKNKLIVESKVVIPEIYVTENLIKENTVEYPRESVSKSDIPKTQGKGKKKRLPKPEKLEENKKQTESNQEPAVNKKNTVSKELESKDLGQSQRQQIKKEKKEAVVDEKEATSRKLKESKDSEQSQLQEQVKKEKEVAVDKKKTSVRTEVAGSKDLNQSQQIKKEKQEAVVDEKEATSRKLKESKDSEQSQLQEQVKKEKEVAVDKNKTSVRTEVAGSKDLNQSQQIKKEKQEAVVDEKDATSKKLKESKGLEQSQLQEQVKKEKEVAVDKKKTTVRTEVAGSKDLNQSQQIKKEKQEAVVDEKEATSIKLKESKGLEQSQQRERVKREKEVVVDKKKTTTVRTEAAGSKDLPESQQEHIKKEKKESTTGSTKLKESKDLEQSQVQERVKKEKEVVIDKQKTTIRTEVAGSKDSQQVQIKKERKEAVVNENEATSTKAKESTDLKQSQQQERVNKGKEVVVDKKKTSIRTEAAGKDLHQSQPEQIKKDKESELQQTEEKVAKENIRTTQEINLSYRQTEIVVPQNIPLPQEKEVVSEKLPLNDLPTSSIIEHYKTKSKQFIASNQTVSTSQEAHTFVSRKIEFNIKTSNISQEQPSSTPEENISLITQTGQKELNIKASTMKTVSQVRVLTLNDNEHQDSTLYRIEKNWTLQFRLGPSLLGRKVSLYCNYPEAKDGKLMEFNRNRYFLLPWSADEGCQNADDTALYSQITVKIAGSFHFYFVYENATESGPQGSGFFLVDPILKYGNDEELPLNCIQCQTVLSKCLGPFSTWESKLRVAKESGYNMIHFTPIQELGESNSAYSLSGQLKLNPSFNDNNKKTTFADVEKLAAKIRTEWKVVSICDIVLNHTANETDWLEQHPESTYNCLNCPYMRPAYLLDAAMHQFSVDVKNGFFDTLGIPSVVCTEDHLNAIRHALHTKVLPEINLSELFICNVNKLVSEFLDRARKAPPNVADKNPDLKLKLVRDPLYQRLATRVDMDLALKIHNIYRPDSFDEESRLKRCGEEFKNNLDQLNKEITDELNIHLNAAVENTIAGIRYFRVQHDGPQIKEITIKNPLSHRYFTDYGKPKSIKEYEELVYGPNSKYLMAHNGWVMNADPMRNFADPDSNVYVRRELIAWGDSVKLRFGDKPEDSPFLWNHMKAYVEQTAKIFDGVRLDNCHSTPIPVAEYLLDCARRVRPDLYVVAELFTNSDHTDNIFVNRLGISSLIREAMSAWDSHEEGRLVYRYGGDPVGAFFQPHFRPLVPSIAHALFLDLTHDNPSPVEKRSVFDLLPSAALVNMACCASGSNRGYDELVNHHIHVVDETRQYTEWTNDESLVSENPRYVSYKSGIISAKRAINDLHFKLGDDGFSQVYVDQMDQDIVAVTRHRPETHQSVILIAFTAFGHPHLSAATYQREIKPLRVEGLLDEIILEATLSHKSADKGNSKYTLPENFVKDKKWINGLSEYHVDIKQHIQLVNSDVFELADSGNPNIIQLNFKNFKPGSVVAIKVSQPKSVQQSIHKLRDLMLSFSRNEPTDLKDVVGRLNLADLNRALYRCDQEEQDEGNGFGAYNIPNFGSLVYCGFQGFMSLLSTIRPSNDLGHPMCGNLRDGNWMIDYIWQRLKLDVGTKELGQWIENNTQALGDIPRYLIPSYFDIIITGIYILLIEQAYNLMSDFVKNGSTFVKGLSLGSLQFAAVIKSADLAILSPNLAPPKPPTKPNDQGKLVQACVTLSAGLPHFSTGYMRNWGRDTFISLRGLFILTGRYQDARYHILGYAACLRHGLIPNLLDGGRNSRFNCRDAVWWWLYCIKSYVEEAPNGFEILSDKVSRIFPTDDSPALEPGVEDQALYEVMQEALKIHFQGLTFRERNAGRQIDAHMTDKGFNNQIGIYPDTGFVFGGNEANCGTWMDKMGSSDKANNRGKPATPRDGCAVELVGLSKAVVTWLSELYQQKKYPYCGVERTSKSGTVVKWTFKQWAEKIQNSFEQFFWINKDPMEGEIRPDLINKRGIYKDSYGATQAWADFQLRCNFPIAMVAAPEMFNPKHAWIALQNAERYLLGPLGMKTLDPDDWGYCGDYNNADDSHSCKTAHGFNYHQGPEWVWPVGYFLRAKLQFAAANKELARTVATTKTILSKHFTELQTSAWRGLPELTNSNGSFCHDSSRTQAWSMACVLEVLHDLQRIESKQQTSVLN